MTALLGALSWLDEPARPVVLRLRLGVMVMVGSWRALLGGSGRMRADMGGKRALRGGATLFHMARSMRNPMGDMESSLMTEGLSSSLLEEARAANIQLGDSIASEMRKLASIA